jgi:glycosyltransferase involved in cell wall biosynthesis
VLSIDGSGGPGLLRLLRARGLPVAVDIAITPLALEIVDSAGRDWPHWPAPRPTAEDRRLLRRWYEEIVGLADLVLYPSCGVLEGLRSLKAFDKARSRHVPYTLGAIDPAPPAPTPGRVLFAGSDVLRKGLPYLAEAAHILRARGRDHVFVVAGAVPPAVRALADVAELTFLGHLSRERMANEMARADLFCLPSLAEGTAAVTLEALASGLPCVVTREAGAPVTDGVEGIVVPRRDSAAIADAIDRIVSDRERRARMADAALTIAATLRPAQVGQRLVSVLGEIAKPVSS